MNLSWVPEAGRSAFCSKPMWWWWSRDDDDDDSWGWIIRMGGMHRKRQKPKSQNDHTPKKTHRNPRKKKKERKKERDSPELRVSLSLLAHKTYKYVSNVEVLQKKALQKFNHLTQCETILSSKAFLYTYYYSTHRRTSLLLQQQCVIQAFSSFGVS